MGDLRFGNILERANERVLFLRWDDDRAKMLGKPYHSEFIGQRLLAHGRAYSSSQRVGAVGNYAYQGFKVIDDVLVDTLPEINLMPSIFSGEARGTGGRGIDPALTISGTSRDIVHRWNKLDDS